MKNLYKNGGTLKGMYQQRTMNMVLTAVNIPYGMLRIGERTVDGTFKPAIEPLYKGNSIRDTVSTAESLKS